MSANVATMFYTRVAPWHGLGTRVESAVSSDEALRVSGLDWKVVQRPVMTGDGDPIPGYRANIRESDNRTTKTHCYSNRLNAEQIQEKSIKSRLSGH